MQTRIQVYLIGENFFNGTTFPGTVGCVRTKGLLRNLSTHHYSVSRSYMYFGESPVFLAPNSTCVENMCDDNKDPIDIIEGSCHFVVGTARKSVHAQAFSSLSR